jgi:hypothetical protein
MKYANLVLVAATGLAAATGALAQAPDFGARAVLHNDGGVIGGGHRMFVGGGSEMLIVDASPAGGEGDVGTPGQPGRFAAIDDNHGDGPQVRYLASVPHAPGVTPRCPAVAMSWSSGTSSPPGRSRRDASKLGHDERSGVKQAPRQHR